MLITRTTLVVAALTLAPTVALAEGSYPAAEGQWTSGTETADVTLDVKPLANETHATIGTGHGKLRVTGTPCGPGNNGVRNSGKASILIDGCKHTYWFGPMGYLWSRKAGATARRWRQPAAPGSLPVGPGVDEEAIGTLPLVLERGTILVPRR